MRISGITIPNNKRLEISLTTLQGIGFSRAKEILKAVEIDFGMKVKDLTPEQEKKIAEEISKFKVEGELKREISGNIKRLKDIQSNRGVRHSKNLPVRGQKTNVNSRTKRGNVRKTMGSGIKKTVKK